MRPDVPTQGLPIASPANMLPVQVVRREEIAPGTVSILIVLPGTKQAPAPYLPGQFVTLALPTPRETLYRSYSLCGDGDAGRPWELTIKRMHMGAVSTYFYDVVGEGTLLYASLPRGMFTLPAGLGPEMTLVMVATGSGITPIMGMLRALDRLPEHERPLVQLHYASKSPDDIIFGDELADMDPDRTWLRQWHYLSSERRRMTAEAILARAGNAAKKAYWYMCGAEALKRDLQARLQHLRVPERHIHSEAFAAQASPAYRVAEGAMTGEGGSLRVAETGATLDAQPNETLLAALERHGYRPSFSCRVGACGACKLKLLEGQAEPAGEALSASELAAGYVLSCIARPIGEVTLASGGRPPAGVARIAAFAGASSGRPAGAVGLTRVAAVASLGVLLLGSWNLTNHRPATWGDLAASPTPDASSTATITTDTPLPGTTPGTTPGATAPAGGKPGKTPTAASGKTPTAGGSQPTPTTTPKPKPTCVSTASKPC